MSSTVAILKSTLVISVSLMAILLMSACEGDDAYESQTDEPVAIDVENCDTTTDEDGKRGFPVSSHTYTGAPSRAITTNQHTTELMLALGLQDSMVGSAYIDDFILPEYLEAYDNVPVLAEKYPSKEVILASEPDFIFAGFASAFRETAAGPQPDLKKLGIATYLSLAVCRDEDDSMQDVYDDISNISRIFEVPKRGDALIASMKSDIESLTSKIEPSGAPIRVFLYDSDEDAPYTSVCCAMFTDLIESVEAKNIFDDVDGTWATVNWEEVIERDPQVIILTEAVWSTAQEKLDFINTSEALSNVTAVKNQRFVTINFSSLTPGIRNPEAIRTLAEGIHPGSFK